MVCAAGAPHRARAQQPRPTTPKPDSTVVQAPDTTLRLISPRAAFLRSVIVPGWGQISAHAYNRAAVFITLQSASWYMLVKTLNKLSDAHKLEDDRLAWQTDSLHTLMASDTMQNRILSDPDSFRVRVAAADTVVAIRSLIDSREEQRQDWIAYTLFLTLASGVDAYVAAHLADFPATISTRRQSNGAYQLKVTVPLRRRP